MRAGETVDIVLDVTSPGPVDGALPHRRAQPERDDVQLPCRTGMSDATAATRRGARAGLVAAWRPSAVTLGRPRSRSPCCSASTPSTSSTGPRSPSSSRTSATTSASATPPPSASWRSTAIAIVLIELPLAFLADRRNRVRIAATGAAIWALFSAATGLAVSVGDARGRPDRRRRGQGRRHPDPLLAPGRLLRAGGAGEGLLRPPPGQLRRSDHRAAPRRRARRAPRLAGTVPPLRPAHRCARAARASAARAGPGRYDRRGRRRRRRRVADVEEAPEGPWSTMRVLGRIPTVRRIWMAAPFLGVALFGVPSLLSLIYEDVFGLESAAARRGRRRRRAAPDRRRAARHAGRRPGRRAPARLPAALRRRSSASSTGSCWSSLAYAPHVAVASAPTPCWPPASARSPRRSSPSCR